MISLAITFRKSEHMTKVRKEQRDVIKQTWFLGAPKNFVLFGLEWHQINSKLCKSCGEMLVKTQLRILWILEEFWKEKSKENDRNRYKYKLWMCVIATLPVNKILSWLDYFFSLLLSYCRVITKKERERETYNCNFMQYFHLMIFLVYYYNTSG